MDDLDLVERIVRTLSEVLKIPVTCKVYFISRDNSSMLLTAVEQIPACLQLANRRFHICCIYEYHSHPDLNDLQILIVGQTPGEYSLTCLAD